MWRYFQFEPTNSNLTNPESVYTSITGVLELEF